MSKYINPYKLFCGAIVPNWLLRRPELSHGAKLTYARLAQYAGESGEAFPRMAVLAEELGLSRRQCQRYVDELINAKLIEAISAEGSSNRYRFLYHEWMTDLSQGVGQICHGGCDTSDMGGMTDMSWGYDTSVTHKRINKRISEENQGIEISDDAGMPASSEGRCAWCSPKRKLTGANQVLKQLHDVYQDVHGECPTIAFGRDGKCIKRLMQVHTVDDIIETFRVYLGIQDDWYIKQGYSIPIFANQYDGIRMRGQNGHTGKHNRKPAGSSLEYRKQLREVDAVIRRRTTTSTEDVPNVFDDE